MKIKKTTRPFKGVQAKLPGETNAQMRERLSNEGERRAMQGLFKTQRTRKGR